MSHRRIVAVANQKGGVGKTTTAVNLATAMALAGRRVLLIDMDPQGNASTGLGLDRGHRKPGVYDVLLEGTPIQRCLRPTAIAGLTIVPADGELAGAELELVSLDRREHRLRDVLDRLEPEVASHVILDCPPSLNLLTLNALVAAGSVLVPLQCEFLALEGLSLLVRTVERVRANLNPRLQIGGIVLTMYDRRNNLSELVAADVRNFFGSQVYETVVPRNIKLSEAPSHGKPVWLYDRTSPGAQAYTRLAEEMLARESAAA